MYSSVADLLIQNTPDKTAVLFSGKKNVYAQLDLWRSSIATCLQSTGINVYPRQVEDVLYTYPGVAEAAVIGVPDETRGEVVKAFITLKPGCAATSGDILSYCRNRPGRFKVPRRVEFMDSLPKSGAGKILRRKLRDIEIDRKE